MFVRYSLSSTDFITRGFETGEYFPHVVCLSAGQVKNATRALSANGFSDYEIQEGTQLQLQFAHLDIPPTERPCLPLVRRSAGLLATAALFHWKSNLFVVDVIPVVRRRRMGKKQSAIGLSTADQTRSTAWYRILCNAILDWALENDVERVYFPTGACLPPHADVPYASLSQWFVATKATVRSGSKWLVTSPFICKDWLAHLNVAIEKSSNRQESEKAICLVHTFVDPQGDNQGNRFICHEEVLRRVLAISEACAIPLTLCVPGRMYKEWRTLIPRDSNHSVAFASYDQNLNDLGQLQALREIDEDVVGYRPPHNVWTPEIMDFNLDYYNFRWLIYNAPPGALGDTGTALAHSIVKIPVSINESALSEAHTEDGSWGKRFLAPVQEVNPCVVELLSCRADLWLLRYRWIIRQLQTFGKLVSCDQFAQDARSRHFCERSDWLFGSDRTPYEQEGSPR